MPRTPRRRRPRLELEQQPDDLPKTGLFTEPVRIDRLEPLAPETLADGSRRAVFLVEVRDAEGKRCSDLAVEASVTGPHRTRTVEGSTDLLGRIRFRMSGPAGTYSARVTDVAAGGLRWDPTLGPQEVATELA